MKVLAVIPAKAGIQAFFLGFRPKACRNDDRAFETTFIVRYGSGHAVNENENILIMSKKIKGVVT